jgi:hypothetical protein
MKALEVFRYQYQYNMVYREFCDHLGRNAASVTEWQQIPYLPIDFFKTRKVICNGLSAATVFTSSGTTGSQPSAHHVADLSVYEGSYLTAFELFYGPVTDFCVLALLPSYLEREGSSLIFMVDDLIRRSGHPDSGFYLSDLKGLHSKLERLEAKKSKVLLIGVSFALLDFAEQFPIRLRSTMVMETGGMKGRRKELVREELHGLLKQGLGLEKIHSEYGMTELLSQAYSAGHGKFRTPPWMQVSIRDPEDPFSFHPPGKTGGINVIDLANINSCSFIATQDLGKLHPDNSFEVLGRFDNSDIRGCNLMLL